MTPDERARWLASLQTFDRVWLGADRTGPGRVLEIVVRGDGAIFEMDVVPVHDLRQPFKDEDATTIHPLPEAPWGRCSTCARPLSSTVYTKGRCAKCSADAWLAVCPGGCKTQKEHDRKVLEQRKRCGVAPGPGA